jgi:hypothetical protein
METPNSSVLDMSNERGVRTKHVMRIFVKYSDWHYKDIVQMPIISLSWIRIVNNLTPDGFKTFHEDSMIISIIHKVTIF